MAAVAFQPSVIASEFNGSLLPARAEPLHEFVMYDPISKETSNTRWKWFWKTVAIATAVTFIAAATFAMVYTTAFYAVHLPLVSIIVYAVGQPLSLYGIKRFMWDKSTLSAREAAIDAEFIKHMEATPDVELSARIRALGVTPGIAPELMKGIFARYCYFKEEQHKALEGAKKIYDPNYPNKGIELGLGSSDLRIIRPQDFTLENIDFEKDSPYFEKLQALRGQRENLLREAAFCNLKAAYILKLMQSPYEKRGLEDFVEFTPFNSQDLLMAHYYGDEGIDILAKAKGNNYTVRGLSKQNTTSLAKEIFELPRGWLDFFYKLI